ncbi:MAG: diaminopimelate epimerase [Candidatus Cloacimonadaceae bacterium]|nr:diaminopimelate epimerase [Candidatus Cloacimonadaceae bacterium]
MRIPFVKMNAQGNDFAILDIRGESEVRFDPILLAKDICDRRFGVGADGLVLLTDSAIAAARMLIYNADGSRAIMCGSALRCISSLLHKQEGITEALIETDAGIRRINISGENIKVSLGTPRLVFANVVVEELSGCLVDVGNYHFVCYGQSLEDEPHLRYGPVFEHHPDLPGAVNSHFVRVISPQEISIKIWEHGVGATIACGTGAAACVLCGRNMGILSDSVIVNMPGGAVNIAYQPDGECILSGTVSEAFSGEYLWKT